jgi:hypothetical protein
MRIDRICYEQLYPTGVFANQRYRVEVLIEEGDYGVVSGHELLTREEAAQRAFKYAKQIVEDTFVALNPQIQCSDKEEKIVKTFGGITDADLNSAIGGLRNTKDMIIEDIGTCGDLKTLETYKYIAKSNTEIEQAYNEKLKSFQ